MTRTPRPPPHHGPDGRSGNPWPDAAPARLGGLLKRPLGLRPTRGRPPRPPSSAFPRKAPAFTGGRAGRDDLTLTWVGHSTFLIQIGGLNLLTDPVWSERASPVQWLGPRRVVPPALAFDALPAIDAVLVSHNHYDHLDAGTVRSLVSRGMAAMRIDLRGDDDAD